MKKLLFSAAMLLAFLFSRRVHGDALGDLRTKWNSGQYQSVIAPLAALWETPGGKRFEVAYMIATSLCRVPDRQIEAKVWFDFLLEEFDYGNPAIRIVVEAESQTCGDTKTQRPQRVYAASVRGARYAGVRSLMKIAMDTAFLRKDSTERKMAQHSISP